MPHSHMVRNNSANRTGEKAGDVNKKTRASQWLTCMASPTSHAAPLLQNEPRNLNANTILHQHLIL